MADKENKDLETEVVEKVTEATEVSADDVSADAAATSDKSQKSEKKSKDEPKKKGFFSRMGSLLKRFWKTMKSELKKVTWFSRKQTFTSTLLVLVVMAVAAIAIGLLDFGFSQGLEALANLF